MPEKLDGISELRQRCVNEREGEEGAGRGDRRGVGEGESAVRSMVLHLSTEQD